MGLSLEQRGWDLNLPVNLAIQTRLVSEMRPVLRFINPPAWKEEREAPRDRTDIDSSEPPQTLRTSQDVFNSQTSLLAAASGGLIS